jgi:acyl carrier protein
MTDDDRLVTCFKHVFPKLLEADVRAASMRRLGTWDSAALLQLLYRVEREFHVRFTPDQVNACTSFEGMLAVLRSMMTEATAGARDGV